MDQILGALATSEQQKLALRKTQTGELYASWADVFDHMRTTFLELWDIFGEVEKRLSSWRRVARAEGKEGKWGPIALSKRGYSFSAGVVQGADPMANKWLIVSFAHGASTQDGMGDERSFGFSGKPADALAGWSRCDRQPDERMLEQANALIERVSQYSYNFDIHHRSLGQRRFEITPAQLGDRSLVDLATALFVALNDDDLEKLKTLSTSLGRQLLGSS